MPEVTSIPSKAIVRQSTKPTSPEEGLLWYDTSAEVLKQFKNGSFANVGASVDGTTIIKDKNGNIRVNKPGTDIIGDFESSLGDWIDTSLGGNASLSTNQAHRGSQSVKLDATDTFDDPNAAIEITTDFSGRETLIIWLYVSSLSFNTNWDFVSIDGTGYVKRGDPSTNQWDKFEIDISSMSGDHTIEIHHGHDGVAYTDDIKLIGSNINVKSEAGN